jgi:hypothetical protein
MGARVRGSREKGFSTYVRHLGSGERLITHVLWAR